MQSKKNILRISSSAELSPYSGLFESLNEVSLQTDIEYLVVGAMARDIVLRDLYGLEPQRATKDVDFCIHVSSWEDFDKFIGEFIKRGGQRSSRKHRYSFRDSTVVIPVDIVPFGPISDSRNQIVWPPEMDTKMSVLGFPEAYENALQIEMPNDLTIKVASLPGLCLLKLIAWLDRPRELRAKDAQDVRHIFRSREKIDASRIYESEELGARYDFDPTLMAIDLLANDVFSITLPESRNFLVDKLLQDENRLNDFALEMGEARISNDRNMQMIDAFVKSFLRLVDRPYSAQE